MILKNAEHASGPVECGGNTPARGRLTRFGAILLLVLACTLVWGFSINGSDLRGTDELRYSNIAGELLGRSNWFYLTHNGEPYDEKPPLVFWTMAATAKVTGSDSPWVFRLPGFLAATACVVMIYLLGRGLAGSAAGMMAALMLMTMPQFSRQAVMARLDMVYTAWTLLALWLWVRSRRRGDMGRASAALFWLALIGAFLSKGPLTPVLVMLLIGVECVRAKSIKPWRMTRPMIGLVALSAAVIGWLWIERVTYGEGFIAAQVSGQTFARLTGAVSHREAPWFYLGSFFGWDLFPWGCVLAFAVFDAAKRSRRGQPTFAAPAMLPWILLLLVPLSLVPGKRPEYLLPAYPAIALVTAAFLERRFGPLPAVKFVRRALSGGAALAAVLVLALALFISPPLSDKVGIDATVGEALALAVAVLALFGVAIAALRAERMRQVIFVSLTLLVLFHGVYMHAIRAERSPDKVVHPFHSPAKTSVAGPVM